VVEVAHGSITFSTQLAVHVRAIILGCDDHSPNYTTKPMAQVHPLWGRPLDQYVSSYGLDAAKERAGWNSELEINQRYKAREVILKICQLAGEGKVVDYNNREDLVTLPMLKSILKLSQSPNTFDEFELPPLVSGCIKLMASVQSSGESSVSTFLDPHVTLVYTP
jgi:hypothetical protein